MVYISKKNKSRVAFVGGIGVYSKPMVVLATAADAKKRATLGGKVWKRLRGTMKPIQAQTLRTAIERYQGLLNHAGIKTIQTKVVITPVKGGYAANLIQPFLKPEELLEHRLRRCNSEDAVAYFKKVDKMIEKIKALNKTLEYHKSTIRIGLDLKPENFAVQHKEVKLLDMFPIMITEKGRAIHDRLGIEPISRLRRTTATFFGNTYIGEGKFIERHTTPSAMKARLVRKFAAVRPELRKEFEEVAYRI